METMSRFFRQLRIAGALAAGLLIPVIGIEMLMGKESITRLVFDTWWIPPVIVACLWAVVAFASRERD